MGVLNSCTSVTRWSTSVIDVGVVYVGIICGCHMLVETYKRTAGLDSLELLVI